MSLSTSTSLPAPSDPAQAPSGISDVPSATTEAEWPPSLGSLPAFSKKQPSTLPSDAATVLSTTAWTLTPSRDGLQRNYVFRSFRDAMSFLTQVAVRCEEENHHPTWTNAYNKVEVLWTTHRPKGLSAKDVRMARYCEQVAAELGEKAPTEKSK